MEQRIRTLQSLASSTAGQARFFLKDLHGDTVGAVNASGAVMGARLYSPWGEPGGSAGETTPLGFQSQPTDADTGLVKTDTRWYEPVMGRFQTRDTLFGDTQDPGSLNQFGYAEGNPVTMSDPTGMTTRAMGCSLRAYAPKTNMGGTKVLGMATLYCNKNHDFSTRVNLQYRLDGTWERQSGSTRLCDDTTSCGHTHVQKCITSGTYRVQAIAVISDPYVKIDPDYGPTSSIACY